MQKVHKNGHKTVKITGTLTIQVNHQNVDPILFDNMTANTDIPREIILKQ